MADAIYSRFDGATYTNVTGVGAVYTLPCEIEVNVTIKIAGRAYPVHPLDTNLDLNLNLKKTAGKKTCIGSVSIFWFPVRFPGMGATRC